MTLFLFALLQLTTAVLNGIPASPDVSPTMSLISRFPGNQNGICGGVAVSRQLVLTSKHCLYRHGARAEEVRVNLIGYRGKGETAVRKSKYFVELSGLSGHEINDDLALLHLQQALPFCNFHQPKIARLLLPADHQQPIRDEELKGAVCSAAGWGINENNEYSSRPLSAYVHLHFEEHGYQKPVLVATYYNPSTRFCAGDSGSPVFCWLRGSVYLVGLLSEIGGHARMDLQKNWTIAGECAQQDHVLVTDLRHKLAEMETLFPGQLSEAQHLCGYLP